MMFGHAVREMAESEPTLLEARIDARLAVVRSWAQDRTWITQEPARPGHDLATALSTSIAPETIRALGAFLEANHVVYGLTGDDRPDAFHIGLYDTIAIEDLTRLLDLLDFVVAATVGR
jgi:phosphoserine aminotransferase